MTFLFVFVQWLAMAFMAGTGTRPLEVVVFQFGVHQAFLFHVLK